MILFPAIDMIDGACVRLVRGDYATAAQVADDILEAARRFAAAGCNWLHMVDLDGAKQKKPVNSEQVRRVLEQTGPCACRSAAGSAPLRIWNFTGDSACTV